MEVRYSPDPVRFSRMTNQEIRDNFLVETLFKPNTIEMVYSDVDRAILGSAVPAEKSLTLSTADELRAEFFCKRRELGVLNVGGEGAIDVDGQSFDLKKLECLYIGRGSREITFSSQNGSEPACFYLLSYPAHKEYPVKHAKIEDALQVHLGSKDTCNERTIYKYIHPDGIESCQLVMGFTEIAKGSVWNTMPPHLHPRRMEAYMYFDMSEENRVFHFMGKPDEMRHIAAADKQAIISPSWSIHSGAGTSGYRFCWGMGGENQDFNDMDHSGIEDFK
ncbi:4-deoxy-L-threo-5-hexosulose-uronate ketol-isomerase [Sedimentisphaera cyanobacteriorum]|uniref:4-deoxy-L-threo-5-hexosulose-uronate ketol-isomerase n=1 Tax=Sedimentisphaera cyanobacteriorum TaxID=1940790 RepID=A0A1Q2HN08_9BACT|nr:5-dehydro-4-deoxy-D-glucuronate isomerase [Sedimentisphaera cyanobacteriorum]AQQ08644.1 4-deoxy-L-threo-5-hexosulose-uronate ketol-isomerase [Sedimentisphaera cyanobacteriorum]